MKSPSNRDITFIVYDGPKAPRYLKISKRVLTPFLVLIPFLVLFSVFFSLATSFYARKKIEIVQAKEPKIIAELRREKNNIADQLKTSEIKVKELAQKVASGTSAAADGILDFSILALPLGMQDLRARNQVKIENFSNQIINKKVVFKFDLLNNLSDEKKLAGYIFVFQYHSYGLSIFPKIPMQEHGELIRFNQGESFRVSRFRPVVAEFPIPTHSSKVWYKALIFSRNGDLLATHRSDDYPLN